MHERSPPESAYSRAVSSAGLRSSPPGTAVGHFHLRAEMDLLPTFGRCNHPQVAGLMPELLKDRIIPLTSSGVAVKSGFQKTYGEDFLIQLEQNSTSPSSRAACSASMPWHT